MDRLMELGAPFLVVLFIIFLIVVTIFFRFIPIGLWFQALVTGVRVSSVQIIATATLGALVGYPCLGTYIVAGLAQDKDWVSMALVDRA